MSVEQTVISCVCCPQNIRWLGKELVMASGSFWIDPRIWMEGLVEPIFRASDLEIMVGSCCGLVGYG